MGNLFKILRDAAGISYALTKVVIGQAIDAAVNGIAVFGFRDSSGNATMPVLNNEGAVVVSFDAGTCIRGMGSEVKANLTKDVETQIMSLSLTADKEYTLPSIRISSFRDLKYRVCKVDDAAGTPVETDIYEGVLGGAQINKDIALAKDCFTAGSTGDQELKVYVTPLDSPDDVYVQASVNELA